MSIFSDFRRAWRGAPPAAGLGLAMALCSPAFALEEGKGEWDALKACEQRLCTQILEKRESGDDLQCALEKTWLKTTLEGAESKLVKWGFGDARCAVDLKMTRAVIFKALTLPAFSLEIPEHHVKCVVESDGEMKPVEVKLAPRIAFKNGRADKVWINLKDVTGPSSIKATVWAAANLEDSLGIFHKSMLKSVNKFMHKRCPEYYGPNAEAFARAKAERRAKRAAEKARAGSGDPLKESAASAPAPALPPVAEPKPEQSTPKAAATQPSVPRLSTPAPSAGATPAAPEPDIKTLKSQPAAQSAPAASQTPATPPRHAKPAEPRRQVRLQLRTLAPWTLDTAPQRQGE